MIMRKTRADITVFATDSNTEDSVRRKLYPTYKFKRSTREKTDEEIALDELAYPQFEEVENYVLPTMGYRNIFNFKGFEADDIIGKVCKTYPMAEIIIVTSDHDMYQLLTDRACIMKPKTMQYYTKKSFEKEYRIKPHMWKRVKAIGGCFDKETELLTDRGWVYFNNLTLEDKAYSMDPYSRIANYEKITDIIKYKYTGPMYSINGPLIDMLITPDHRFFGYTTQSYPLKNKKFYKGPQFKEIKEIVNYKNFTIPITSIWKGNRKEKFILPRLVNKISNKGSNSERLQIFPDLPIKMDTWVAFLGIYLADGHVSDNGNGRIGTIGISAFKERKMEYFKPILDSTPWKWARCKDGWNTNNRQLAEYLYKLGHAKEKYIPREFLNLSREQLQILFDSMMAGDGCISTYDQNVFGKRKKITSSTYYSSSRVLINNFQELAIKLGHAVTISEEGERKWHIKGKSGISSISYAANMLKSNNVNLGNKNIKVVNFDDYVFDVETKPHHTIFVRRGKNSIWSANCSSDEVAGVPGVGEKTALKYIKGELPEHYKVYKTIVSKKGKKIINRNKSLVILPFRGTPKCDLQPDTVSKIKLKGVAEKYKFKSILQDLENWVRILKGWAPL